MKCRHRNVNDAVLAFLRAELERRYLYDNVRRFKELKGIPPYIVADFREFVLRRIYPEAEARKVIDEAFAELHELLRSPRKMASLGRVALSAAWRLGSRLPVAVSAAQHVIHAFACASAVETLLSEAVAERGLSWRSGLKEQDVKAMLAQLPPKAFEELIDALVQLLELAANRDTMQTGLGLLEELAETMSRSSDEWTDISRHGVALAMDTIAEALALFSNLDGRSVPRFIKGVKAVETDWYQTLRAGN